MSIISESEQRPENRAIAIVADALRVLRTRDGIEIPEELIAERSRNIIAAVLGDYDLVPHDLEAATLDDPFAHLEVAERHLRAIEARRQSTEDGHAAY